MRYRYVLGFVLCIAVSIAAVIFTVVRTIDRNAEWAHGGDRVTLAADLRLTDEASYADTVAALGGPADQPAVDTADLVVEVRWSGPNNRAHDGYYEFVVLSRPGGPTLLPSDAWGAGDDVFGWDGRYQALSEHYPWLAGTKDVSDGQGGVSNNSLSTGVPAVAQASVTIALAAGDLVSNPGGLRRVVVGVFYVRDGDVRWAKQIPPAVDT